MESAGGTLHCNVIADMPRDIKEVKNARQRLKEKDENDQFASLLDLSRQEPAVRNLHGGLLPQGWSSAVMSSWKKSSRNVARLILKVSCQSTPPITSGTFT